MIVRLNLNARNILYGAMIGVLGYIAVDGCVRSSMAKKLDAVGAERVQTCGELYGQVATGASKLAKEGCIEGHKRAISGAKDAFHAWW